MHRVSRPDAILDTLNDERDHLAIQISLLGDSDTPDPARLAKLRDQLFMLERRISQYKPADA